jgi:hypothetical protein
MYLSSRSLAPILQQKRNNYCRQSTSFEVNDSGYLSCQHVTIVSYLHLATLLIVAAWEEAKRGERLFLFLPHWRGDPSHPAANARAALKGGTKITKLHIRRRIGDCNKNLGHKSYCCCCVPHDSNSRSRTLIRLLL